MRTQNFFVIFLLLAIGSSAVAVLLSFWAISARYRRSNVERDRQLLEVEKAPVPVYPSTPSRTLSMAERQRNIETMLLRLEGSAD